MHHTCTRGIGNGRNALWRVLSPKSEAVSRCPAIPWLDAWPSLNEKTNACTGNQNKRKRLLTCKKSLGAAGIEPSGRRERRELLKTTSITITAHGLLTPRQVHYGSAKEVIAARNEVLDKAMRPIPRDLSINRHGRWNQRARCGLTDPRQRRSRFYTNSNR